MAGEHKIAHNEVFALAAITRGQYRKWNKLLAPIANKHVKRPSYTAAQTLTVCVLGELMNVLDCGTNYLVPITERLFNEICSGDWRRLEHRLLVLSIDRQTNVDKGKINTKILLNFELRPRTEMVLVPTSSTVVALDLARFVQTINTFLTGISVQAKPFRLPSLQERQRGQAKRKKLENQNEL